jgi:hypothetical protein
VMVGRAAATFVKRTAGTSGQLAFFRPSASYSAHPRRPTNGRSPPDGDFCGSVRYVCFTSFAAESSQSTPGHCRPSCCSREGPLRVEPTGASHNGNVRQLRKPDDGST